MTSDNSLSFDVEAALASTPQVHSILRAMRSDNLKFWLVGGGARDILSRRKITDLDLVTELNPPLFLDKIGPGLGFSIFPLDVDRGFYRLTRKQPSHFTVDILRMHGNSIEEDLSRRDFTINAMAIPLCTPLPSGSARSSIVDPFGGLGDLEKRILRPVTAHSLEDDPVRVLRAHRLALVMGLSCSQDMERMMAQAAGALGDVAAERILMELAKIMAHPQSHKTVAAMAHDGTLSAIFPEAKLEQTTMADKTLEAISRLDEALRNTAQSPYLDEPVGAGITRNEVVKIAAMLCYSRQEDGTELKRLAYKASRRLKAPSMAAKGVAAMAWGWRRAMVEPPDDGAVFDWMRVMGDWTEGALLLARSYSSVQKQAIVETFSSTVNRIAKQWIAAWPPGSPPITGQDIMATLDLAAGPEVGRLLAEAEKAAALGKISGKDEALAYIKGKKPGFRGSAYLES